MAQLAPLAAAAGAGATLYATAQQARLQKAANQQGVANAQAQQAAQAASQAVQQAADTRARDARLAGTVASARARLAAGGVAPDEGSAGALVAGLQRDSAAVGADSDAAYAARLSAGRRSLLQYDGSLTPWLRAGTSLGTSFRNLLE